MHPHISVPQSSVMSGPTWLPPRTLGSPERTAPAMSHTGPSYYRPPKMVPADQRPKYGMYEQNGGPGGGGGMPTRYLATGPTGATMQHPEAPGPAAFQSGEHYYPPTQERLAWNSPMGLYDHQGRGPEKHHSNIDAEIDSLTCMLADLDSHSHSSAAQFYDNVPYNKHPSGDRYKPAASSQGVLSQGRPSMGYPPHPQNQYHASPPYNPQPDYSYQSAAPHKPYPQPVPASYTTASTPTGPRFSVQVKTAQPVTTYSQTGRQAEQAYTPPAPRQLASRPSPPDRPPYPDHPAAQAWYPLPPSSQEPHPGDPGYSTGAAVGPPAPRPSQGPPPGKKGLEAAGVQSAAYQPGKASMPRPEEELDRLTKKLVYDMNHPPAEEYFGRCARCGDNVLGDGSGCVAMEQVFHVECFTCITCHARLRGQPFYALDKKSYCESCYISTLERCSKCSNPILDRILRAMGKAYHPRCFSCVVCGCCLDGVPFTVDATSQIHCIEDFHRKFAPRCSVCGQAIMPEPGQEETVRIVALDRSFHVNCYTCEECGLLLSSEGEGRGCYPLDGHILCKSCSARRIQDLSAKISTDC
ncbi:thyroid receptor-interacting protein 6-like isoform X1 [Denticeps clupeoides]|uniref:thyroid receptor-interacting protein 6-like isoform X1 n=2 Tax=Denticeps clupeoides TaxID=299321 RepID=UPI0010A311BB|nr:thyroid receptor-interacting protein 6-like isoform X1 [Denticeps clupeoides]XP_028820857.1 thyroid receptor-interacting protein 6-like isoform X1 [Denticeps clupeoides]